MSTLLQITDARAPLRWPSECAWCNDKSGRLRPVQVGIAREQTHLKDLARQRLVWQSASLTYPACERHVHRARLASWLTRRSPLPALVRGAAWTLGPLAMLSGGLWLITALLRAWRAAPVPPRMAADVPWVFVGVSALAALALVLVVMARREVPVRLLRWRGDALSLRFANAAYARRFLRANAHAVARKE